tara:strand:+ start:431 stop:715 length:285 start_codon:yes stop_codon:yes gene_type:complete
MTDNIIDEILETVVRQFNSMLINEKKIILNILGMSKADINNLKLDNYNDELKKLYIKKLKTIDQNNIDDEFIKINRFISGKLKKELTKLINNYE